MATCTTLPTDRDPLLLRNERCVEHDRDMLTCILLTAARSIVDWRRRQNLLAFEVYGDLADVVGRVDAAEAAYAARVAEQNPQRPGVGAIDPPVTSAVPLLHVHGQAIWHEPVMIIGSRAGLGELRTAVSDALEHEFGGGAAFTADGEGYDVVVVCDDTADRWNRAQLPYHDEGAIDHRPDALSPGARPEMMLALADRRATRRADRTAR